MQHGAALYSVNSRDTKKVLDAIPDRHRSVLELIDLSGAVVLTEEELKPVESGVEYESISDEIYSEQCDCDREHFLRLLLFPVALCSHDF
jgi:hypothetical protein